MLVSRRLRKRKWQGAGRRNLSRQRAARELEQLEARVLLSSAVRGVGTGLVGDYFSDLNLANLAATKANQAVDFQFGSGSPAGSIDPADFSARWSGKVQAQYSEDYTFYTQSDQPVRVWVNDQEVIDDWQGHALAEDSGTVALSAGEFYDIKVEYQDHASAANLQLEWSSPSTAKEIIPAAQLYGSGGWVSGNWLDEQIGTPSGSGFAVGDSSGYTVQAGNGSFGSIQSDDFHYLYQMLNGDGTLIAQLSTDQSDAWPAEAGLMIRDSSDPSAKFVALGMATSGGAELQYRQTDGDLAGSGKAIAPSGADWLKLERDGSFFTAYLSPTGADGTWILAGTADVEMGQTVEAGLAVAGGSAGPLAATFRNVSITPTVELGAGVDQVRDYSLGNVFVDVAKQMRTPQTPDFGPSVATDANGWPTADFGSIFITGFINSAHIYNGTYKLSFTGKADVSPWSVGPTAVRNVAYNAATNTTTADVIISADEDNPQWYCGLIFTDTQRTPTSPVGGGITNIRMVRPGYDPNTTQIFTNEYLAHLKQFTVLRFMDFTQTNNNPVVNWSDRTKLTDARQSTTKGVAWEYVIGLANQLHKNVWINIPEGANDDYIKNLAELFKAKLSPDLVVYVEYSNEVWNGQFQQFADNLNQAIAEVKSGNSPLNNDGSTNQYYWAWRRVGERLKQISDIFGSVYGSKAINSQIRPVLATQFANPEVIRQQLEFLERTYGSPSQYIYGIAEAPYFSAPWLDSNPSATAGQYIAGFGDSINGDINSFHTFTSWAQRYGLKNLAYEGGPDTFGPNNIPAKIAASLDPRMAGLVVQYLDGWYSQGGGLFNWFIAGPTNWNSTSGTWGLSNAIDNLNTPKIQGTITVVNNKAPLTYGIPVPATWDARQQAGTSPPYSDLYLQSPGQNNSVDYFVRADETGNYKLTLSAGTSGSNEQVLVTVNSSARAITLKNTGSASTFVENDAGNINLIAGINLIRLTSVNQSAGWNLQTLTVAAPNAQSSGPSIAQPPTASALINGKSVNLSILGADAGGESNLTYSWQAIGEAPGSVLFSANGSNAAKNTTATFGRAGTYTLECTVFNGSGSVSASVQVTVQQLATSIAVSPGNSFVPDGGQQVFKATAYDQFGMAMAEQPSFVWTLDAGSIGSIAADGTYTVDGGVTGSATVRATSGSLSGTAKVLVQVPRAPENPANALPGINYKYFEGLWPSLPDFDSLTPVKTGTLSTINLSPQQTTTGVGFQFFGYISVPTTGTYTFYTDSDDGSQLFIGNTLVVNNDGAHFNQERSGQIVLAAGRHALSVTYFQGTGDENLQVQYAGPGISKQNVPASALWHTRHAPTVVAPASVVPYPVPGNHAALSVLGGDESGESSLTYTWSTLDKPEGAPDPDFGANGNNSAKNSTVTFGQAGDYEFQVSISNGFASTTSSVSVSVDQSLRSLKIVPSQSPLALNASEQIQPTGFDQFGQVMQTLPALTWSVENRQGTIDPTGLYTAPSAAGDYIIRASFGAVIGGTMVQVRNTAPKITEGPTVTVNPSGTTAKFHVLASDDGGASNLVYTWSLISKPDGAADPIFSINGTNAASDTVVTFGQSGQYSFRVDVSDGSLSTEAQFPVTISTNQAPTVAQAATATPMTGTSTTVRLAVLGADDGGEANLTYTWEATSKPAGAPDPVFSANGTNAASDSIATYGQTGSYSFLVTISDGSLSVTSSVNTSVTQKITSVGVLPSNVSVSNGQTQQFSATAFDQFGDVMASQPAITWSRQSGGAVTGTISAAGLYTAPASGTAQDTVIASATGPLSEIVQGSATVTINGSVSQSIFTGETDIGSPATAGSSTFANGTYTVSGGGNQIWDPADQFHYVYKSISGDATIVTRVAGVQNTNLRATAGVMFRETFSSTSKQVLLELSPDRTATLSRRTYTGGGMATVNNVGTYSAPYYLKLVRSGNTFTGYISPDGSNWTALGSTSVSMNTTIYVGLAVCSHDATALNTSSFDHVSVTAADPPPVAQSIFTSDGDIGSPTTAGSSAFANGTYTVSGGGNQIWDPSDQFHYVYKSISGDATIVARVARVQKTDLRATAGVMFRETLSSTSKQVLLELSPDRTATLSRRTSTGSGMATVTNAGVYSAPYYLKLVRSGNLFTGYISPDGTNWTALGSTSVSMNTTIYVGLAVCAHDPTALNTSTFDNVSISAVTQAVQSASPVKVSVNPLLLARMSPANMTSTSSTSASVKPLVTVNVPTLKTIAQQSLATPE